MVELFGRGTVTGFADEGAEGKTGQPSTKRPFVPRTTRKAYAKDVDVNVDGRTVRCELMGCGE